MPFCPFRPLLFCAGLLAGGSPVLSHEFWIAPDRYQVASGAPLTARLRNGEEFRGAEQPYLDHRIARFAVIRDGSAQPYTGRMGDMPAFAAPEMAEGLAVIVHQTRPRQLIYDSWEAFQAFADHKGFSGIRSDHRARGLPEAGFAEQYTRYAKALVAAGEGRGSDRAVGLETEIVALANPYTDALPQGLPVQVLYRGAPRPRAQVEIFAKAPGASVAITTLLTDDQGQANIPVTPGYRYLLDAVLLRPAPEDADYVWESHWASLTFALPAP